MSLTVAQALGQVAARLAQAGIADPRFEARLLVAAASGLTPGRMFAFPETELTPDQAERLDAMTARRAARQPMAHILGRRGFWTLELEVTADTLDPRPDTETLVEAVLNRVADRQAPLRLLDLGLGTGCILLALLSELPNARGLGIDASAAALAVARRNAAACGLAERAELRLGDWDQGVTGPFDIITSNPPYIPQAEMETLEPEVRLFEPRLALVGGADGLDCYRRLAPALARLLAPGGLAALEIGHDQALPVAGLLRAAGLTVQEVIRDLGGQQRVILAGLTDKP